MTLDIHGVCGKWTETFKSRYHTSITTISTLDCQIFDAADEAFLLNLTLIDIKIKRVKWDSETVRQWDSETVRQWDSETVRQWDSNCLFSHRKVAHASSCPGVRLVDNWWTADGQLDTPGQLMDMYSSTPSTDSYPLAPSHFRVDKNTNKDISADEFKRKVQDHNMTLIKPNWHRLAFIPQDSTWM